MRGDGQQRGKSFVRSLLAAALLAGNATGLYAAAGPGDPAEADASGWAVYGRTNRALHHSPLDEIDQANVAALGLAWSLDLRFGNTNTQPLAIDGVLDFATGLSIVHAFDAATGGELWHSDPEAFRQVVKDGALAARGMPGFGEFPEDKLENLRQYILAEAAALGKANSAN